MTAMAGQVDVFDILGERPPVTIPPFTVWTSSRASIACGWCGSRNLTGEGCGGGAGRGPGNAPWYTWDYCNTCATKYGRPEPHRPGYPIRIGVRA